MHPAELLNRRPCAVNRRIRKLLPLAGKADAIPDRPELVAARFPELDGKANEIARRPSLLPVHRQQRHAVTSMNLQREWRLRIRAGFLEAAHVLLACERLSRDGTGCAEAGILAGVY